MIPRIIHQIWLGQPMPLHLWKYVETWSHLHPNWLHLLWTDVESYLISGVSTHPLCSSVPSDLTNQSLYNNAPGWAPGSEGQFRSDLLRYELLQRYGGVYVDCDFEAKKPIDDLVGKGIKVFAAWETPNQWIGNAILGAQAGHPFLTIVINGLSENVQRLAAPGVRPNQLTGPQYLTKKWQNAYETIDGAKIYDKRLFYPYLYNQLDQGNQNYPAAYAVHHWNNKRKGQPVNVDSDAQPNSGT